MRHASEVELRILATYIIATKGAAPGSRNAYYKFQPVRPLGTYIYKTDHTNLTPRSNRRSRSFFNYGSPSVPGPDTPDAVMRETFCHHARTQPTRTESASPVRAIFSRCLWHPNPSHHCTNRSFASYTRTRRSTARCLWPLDAVSPRESISGDQLCTDNSRGENDDAIFRDARVEENSRD